jgi:phosphatidylinositol-4-phosphate 3-kinase
VLCLKLYFYNSHASLLITENLEKELEKLENAISQSTGSSKYLQFKGVWQSVKLICALLGCVETLKITEALDFLSSACQEFSPSVDLDGYKSVLMPEIERDEGDYSIVSMCRKTDFSQSKEKVLTGVDRLRDAIQSLIESYCGAFRVAFLLKPKSESPTSCHSILDFNDEFCIHISALHRLAINWHHMDYLVCYLSTSQFQYVDP